MQADFAVILAAGRGTRMKSELAKVLHPILGRPMVAHVAAAASAAGLAPVVVVNHQEEAVRAALQGSAIRFARQEQTRGTGDAVASALSALPDSGTVVVMAGDAPLLRAETISRLHEAHGDAAVTVLTAVVEDGAHYGRLERDGECQPLRIVEAREATPDQLAIREINTGLYCFDIGWLRTVLPTLKPHAHKDEIYLTDVVEIAAQQRRCHVLIHDDLAEVQGVNDRFELGQAREVMQARIVEHHARNGVDFERPSWVVVEPDVTIAPDVRIGPGVILRGQTRIAAGAQVGAHCEIINAVIGEDACIHSFSQLDSATIERGGSVGPYARLRPGSWICEGARVGNFVEIKASRLGPGAKANHLTYLGDTTVGSGANIGAGTITCNYDGFNKSKTDIGDGAFIGSNTALVAPITVGEGAIVGAGSVITKAVPSDAVAIARGVQNNIEGAAGRFRARKATK